MHRHKSEITYLPRVPRHHLCRRARTVRTEQRAAHCARASQPRREETHGPADPQGAQHRAEAAADERCGDAARHANEDTACDGARADANTPPGLCAVCLPLLGFLRRLLRSVRRLVWML